MYQLSLIAHTRISSEWTMSSLVDRKWKGKGRRRDCGNRKNEQTPMPSLRKPSLCYDSHGVSCDKDAPFYLSLVMRDIQSKRLSWKSLLQVLSFSLTSRNIKFKRDPIWQQWSWRASFCQVKGGHSEWYVSVLNQLFNFYL